MTTTTLDHKQPSRPTARAGEGLSVSEVAAAGGIAPSAVRFYEKRGLIHATRSSGNQRRFDESVVCRIHVARLAQRVGLTVAEIVDLFTGLNDLPGPRDWASVAEELVASAEKRVGDLRAHLEALGSGAKLCDLGSAAERFRPHPQEDTATF